MDEILLSKIDDMLTDLKKESGMNKHPNFSAAKAVEINAKISVLIELKNEIKSLIISS